MTRVAAIKNLESWASFYNPDEDHPIHWSANSDNPGRIWHSCTGHWLSGWAPTVTQFAVEPLYVEKPGLDGKRPSIRCGSLKSRICSDLHVPAADRVAHPGTGARQSHVGSEIPNSAHNPGSTAPHPGIRTLPAARCPLGATFGLRDVSGSTGGGGTGQDAACINCRDNRLANRSALLHWLPAW